MANTPFLNLVKPTDTDQALITDINNNSDKIDTGVSTLSEQIATYEIPTNTMANIEAALVTYASGLANNEIRTVKFTVSSATTMFAASSYVGTIRKVSSDRYNVLVQGFLEASQLFTGNYRNSTWTWEQVATSATASSIPKFLYLGAPTLPVTLNVPSNSRTFLFVSGPYTNRGYGIVVVACNASGSVQPNIVGGNVLSATSSATNKVTIADTVGGTTSSAITAMTIYGDLPYIAT